MVDSALSSSGSVPVSIPNNLPEIRTAILEATREEVRQSEFTTALTKIQAHLDAIPDEPLKPGMLSSATTEQEMDRAIIETAIAGYNADPLQTWATEGVNGATSLLMIAALFNIGIGAFFLTAGVTTGAWWMYLSASLFLITTCAMPFADIYPRLPFSALNVRNKVICRKRYKRELVRLVHEAESVRERHARLSGVRKAKLAAAKKALEPFSQDFAIAYPGKKLAIVGNGDNGKLAISSVEDSRYSEIDKLSATMIPNMSKRSLAELT